jgi:hypothetical protein
MKIDELPPEIRPIATLTATRLLLFRSTHGRWPDEAETNAIHREVQLAFGVPEHQVEPVSQRRH